jgi:Uncharacterised nucleotidyltransferase
VHGHLAHGALRRAVMGVTVHHDVRTVHADRGRKASRPEERPDRFGLTYQGVRDGCVVQENDPNVTAGDGLEALFERLDLERRLLVDPAEERLAEVGQFGAREAADEPFHADDADFPLADLEDQVLALQDANAARVERVDELHAAIRMVIVVAEDGDHRNLEGSAGIGEDRCLLGKPVRRQIAREKHEVTVLGHRGERARQMVAERLDGMDVACRGDADGRRHEGRIPTAKVVRTPPAGRQAAMPSDRILEELVATMKRAAAILRDAEVPFMLGGGLAAWACGGPRTDNDVDLFVREEDAERALQALVRSGMRPERPPEDWLLKAYDGDVLVDLIYRPLGGPIDDEFFERADELEVLGHSLLVASIDDVFVSKVLALTEQEPDYQAVLELARALREQIDWGTIRIRTADSPFARAFFTLVEGLGIVDPSPALRERAEA